MQARVVAVIEARLAIVMGVVLQLSPQEAATATAAIFGFGVKAG
jgi:hypothetical protein